MALNLGKLALDVIVNGKGLDELNNKINDTSSSLSGLEAVGKKVVGVLSFTAVATSIYKIGKAAISAYADFQQLTGGVETLFGESAAQVMDDASRAYTEAGITANEYMEQATSFGASLVQSLGGDTKKAVEYANTAILDMSDNANKMGTNIEMIQNAYQGFSKQNFSMLDNLKLGYGGTKTEMERLISDAEKISDLDFDIDSYADIVQAIHIIQQENGITGTTAEEAATTITGSLNMMKAAWTDMLTVIANPESSDADVTTAIQNFADSLQIFLDNILPVIENMLPQIVSLFSKVFSSIYQSLKENGTIDEIKEALANAIKQAIHDLIEVLPEALSEFSSEFPGLFATAIGITALKRGIIGKLKPAISGGATEAIAAAEMTGVTAAFSTVLTTALTSVNILGILVAAGFTVDALLRAMLGEEKYNSLYGAGGTAEMNEVTTSQRDGQYTFEIKTKGAETAKKTIETLKKDMDELPPEVVTVLESIDNASTKINILMTMLDKLPTEKRIKVYTTYMEEHKNLSDNFSPSGEHRIGKREVPYDGYRAKLHQGEVVLTAAESNQYQKYLDGLEKSSGSGGVNISVTGNTFRNRDDIDYLCTEIQKKISRQLAR